MNPIKRIALFAALFAAQLALAAACHGEESTPEADNPHTIATASYPDGVEVILLDRDVGHCMAMASYPPDSKDFVPGCWQMEAGQVKVTYLLPEDVEWVETYPVSDFRLTPYGVRVAKNTIHVSPL